MISKEPNVVTQAMILLLCKMISKEPTYTSNDIVIKLPIIRRKAIMAFSCRCLLLLNGNAHFTWQH